MTITTTQKIENMETKKTKASDLFIQALEAEGVEYRSSGPVILTANLLENIF